MRQVGRAFLLVAALPIAACAHYQIEGDPRVLLEGPVYVESACRVKVERNCDEELRRLVGYWLALSVPEIEIAGELAGAAVVVRYEEKGTSGLTVCPHCDGTDARYYEPSSMVWSDQSEYRREDFEIPILFSAARVSSSEPILNLRVQAYYLSDPPPARFGDAICRELKRSEGRSRRDCRNWERNFGERNVVAAAARLDELREPGRRARR